MKTVLHSLLVLCCMAMVTAQETPRTYVAYHTKKPIVIDGKDTEAAWGKVAWSTPFIDIEGVKTPKYKTQIKMLWDDTYFYILAQMEEPHVWGDITQHDAVIFHNNDFEVFLDPEGDVHGYYELEWNVLNTVWDQFLTKPYRDAGNQTLNGWESLGLKSAVSIQGTLNDATDTDKGWVLEMALPFQDFRTAYYQDNTPKDKFWRVNFSRVNWDFQLDANNTYQRKKGADGKHLPEYNWVWSPQGVISMHEPETWGYVYFSSKAAGKKDSFSIPNDEKIKWQLYKMYHAQKQYFTKHGQWATTINQLHTAPFKVEAVAIPMQVELHSTGWQIQAKSPFTNKTLVVTENGKFITL